MKHFKKKSAGCPAWILEAVHQKRIEATLQSKPTLEHSQDTENSSQRPLQSDIFDK
jgi:hypothetical protein